MLVSGDLGTGKTTFVRGACRGLGVEGPVTSPSFTIGRTYAGRVPVSHVDLFRLDTLEGEDPALLADYLRLDAIAFVEWPKAAASELEPERVAVHVRLSHRGGDSRRVELEGRQELIESARGAVERGSG